MSRQWSPMQYQDIAAARALLDLTATAWEDQRAADALILLSKSQRQHTTPASSDAACERNLAPAGESSSASSGLVDHRQAKRTKSERAKERARDITRLGVLQMGDSRCQRCKDFEKFDNRKKRDKEGVQNEFGCYRWHGNRPSTTF
ncbi:hypothetical protein QBC40DRAFT_254304 [Triangularia verruculosa]|uniref:Uncharacterized protein n=1 Tax=Triangularia verruculosa TaxID=2587418 RepID=A0AAN7AV22_9PEZI|nr:hypothetical protein QBC40DRAFT_254304 [Triangularia verruculosa]